MPQTGVQSNRGAEDDTGGTDNTVNVTQSFDDAAASSLPDVAQIVSGTFKPTNVIAVDSFPGPAPAGPYGGTLATFNGTSPNVQWQFFVVDDSGVDVGSLAGGWSLTITTNVAPPAADDSATIAQDAPVAVAVLPNDSDPDGTLDPATVGEPPS